MRITLYARPGCHLCEEAREILLEMIAERGLSLDLEEVDIDADERLLTRFLERIPVIEVDGKLVSELEADRDALARALHTVAS